MNSMVEQRYTICNKFIRIEEREYLTAVKYKSKIVYCKKLTTSQVDLIIQSIIGNELFSLNEKYETYLMGGYVDWFLQINLDEKTKNIHVVNERVDAIDSFFSTLNQYIPQKKHKIARYYYN